jgi:rod shape-determining protein MreC
MLWDRIQQLSEILSLLFCIGFSIVSLFWNSNLVVRTVASSQKAVDVITSSVDSAGGVFSGLYQRFQSNEVLRKERDSYAKLVDEYKVYFAEQKAEKNKQLKALNVLLKANKVGANAVGANAYDDEKEIKREIMLINRK